MILPRFDFEAPRSLTEACALLAEAGEEGRVLAGGTDLLVKMKRAALTPRLLVSLARVEALDGIEETEEGGLRLGPLATMSRLASSPALRGPWAAIAEGAASVAGPLIRNRATVGGNIVNARPCADTVPALIALGARLLLDRSGESRTVELDGFITGPGETVMGADEILTAVSIPAPRGGGAGSCYVKITRRSAMEVTIAGCAASVVLDPSRTRVRTARVVLASVAPVPLRVREVEELLADRVPDRRALEEAAAAARRAAKPIDDFRAPAFYRREIVEVIARRALAAAVQRANDGRPS
jgi:carbon-monoxide dehydrogenase medium subunit